MWLYPHDRLKYFLSGRLQETPSYISCIAFRIKLNTHTALALIAPLQRSRDLKRGAIYGGQTCGEETGRQLDDPQPLREDSARPSIGTASDPVHDVHSRQCQIFIGGHLKWARQTLAFHGARAPTRYPRPVTLKLVPQISKAGDLLSTSRSFRILNMHIT